MSERLLTAAERNGGVLLSEVRAPELPRLRGRQPWGVECLHDLVGEVPLIGRKTRRIVPAQSSSDVGMHPCLRASELVGAPMQLPHLLEQRLEPLVIDRQERSTLLAAERSLDELLAHAPLVSARAPCGTARRAVGNSVIRPTIVRPGCGGEDFWCIGAGPISLPPALPNGLEPNRRTRAPALDEGPDWAGPLSWVVS